ncbi:MAG: DUF1990 family protein [Solirubrobacteraceae bacterium]
MNQRIRKRIAQLADTPVNFDPDSLDLAHPPAGWRVDDRRQSLPAEAPGEPVGDSSWEIARRLIKGYEFADPSMVRAFYDPQRPLAGRDMLLELRTLRYVRVYVGVRVGDVYDEIRERDGRQARVFGWYYRTLQGHVEQGQMNWEVWKWLDTGAVEFRVHAVSRTARIQNPFVRVGFWVLRDHERSVFINSTCRRMVSFTELALQAEGRGERLRAASPGLTARDLPADDPSHEALARRAEGEA